MVLEEEDGGWYGGGAGTGQSNNSTTYRKYSGGGSGFIWTANTASNVPTGYSVSTKYYLTNAETYAGDTEFISTSNGTETGHSGNGYARITLVNGTKTESVTAVMWINIEERVQEGTLTGNFDYNGKTITEIIQNNNTIIHQGT